MWMCFWLQHDLCYRPGDEMVFLHLSLEENDLEKDLRAPQYLHTWLKLRDWTTRENERTNEYSSDLTLGFSAIHRNPLFRAVLEHKNLAQLDWSAATIGCFILFALSMFVFYSLVTIVLQKTSALMFNLATLTADFYSLLFGLFLFKETVGKYIEVITMPKILLNSTFWFRFVTIQGVG